MTAGELLKASALPALEAQVLAAHALGVDRAWLAAHRTDALGQAERARIESLFERRRAGEPVAYIVGEREFYGLALRVSPDVLIPRPETELLVELALERLPEGGSVLDLGTGSGAIAIAIARHRPDARVTAGESSRKALAVARANAARHGVHVRFEESDWFGAFAGKRFDLVVSNPPYLASDDPHLGEGDLRFEPRSALDAGPTGMEALERIVREARAHLCADGWLLMEHGYDQGDSCRNLLLALGYCEVADYRDLAGRPRVVAGRCELTGS